MNKHSRQTAGGRIRPEAAGFLAGVLFALLICVAPYSAAAPDVHTEGTASYAAAAGKGFQGHLPITELTEDEAILHALNRLAYGPRPGDVERIRQMGLEKWVKEQLEAQSADDAAVAKRLEQYPTLAMSGPQLIEDFARVGMAARREGVTQEQVREQREQEVRQRMEQMRAGGETDPARLQLARLEGPQRVISELSMAKLTRAVYSEHQLQEVMADFWFNHFNVFSAKALDTWVLPSYERNVIRAHALGKFEDLLNGTAQSPAMLMYLDNWLSVDPNASARQQRELAKSRRGVDRFLSRSGMFMSPQAAAAGLSTEAARRAARNGSKPKAPGNQQKRGLNENYGRELMELHTLGVDGGYAQQDVIEVAKCFTGWTLRTPQRDPEFYFDERIHVPGSKTVLGQKIHGGGMKDGEEVLHLLARHTSTARFISMKLARHFVSDSPPPALVERMAETFQQKNGDIRAILRTMTYSPEFWSREAFRAKVKTPFELVASTVRALGAEAEVPLPLVRRIAAMGQPLYYCVPPTGYSDKAEAWVNTGALLNRLNFALELASNHLPGAHVELAQLMGQDAAPDPHAALTRALNVFLDGQVSPQTRETLEKRLTDPQVLRARLDDPVQQVNVNLIAGLVLGSPEFQRR